MNAEPVFGEMLSRLRRAAKNGTRLHLDPEHVAALLDDDIYAVLSAREAKEFRSQCRPVQPAERESAPSAELPQLTHASSLGHSGSGIVPIGTTGTSAGLMDVQPAAHRRVSEVAAELRLRTRKKA
jgi:hypothetical protein